MESKLNEHPRMAVILGISSAVLFFPHTGLLKFLAEHSLPLHQLCLNLTPTGSYKIFYDAIVCGEPLAGPRAEAFRITGLIHLIVVSGAHLAFLVWAMEALMPGWRALHFLVLAAFVLVTGLQPPALRGLAVFLFSCLSRALKLNWSSLQICLLSGIALWAVFPELIASFSFLLSWAAALSLTLSTARGLARHALIFLLLLPILAPLGPPHPASILLNWFFVPVVGGILFPLSLAATLVPGVRYLADPLWMGLETILKGISDSLTIAPPQPLVPVTVLWIYVWGLHFAGHFRRIGFARA